LSLARQVYASLTGKLICDSAAAGLYGDLWYNTKRLISYIIFHFLLREIGMGMKGLRPWPGSTYEGFRSGQSVAIIDGDFIGRYGVIGMFPDKCDEQGLLEVFIHTNKHGDSPGVKWLPVSVLSDYGSMPVQLSCIHTKRE